MIRRETKCSDCGDELGPGRLLRMEGDRPLCLSCADLDHLEFLGRGDTALTRRASKYSRLRAVVVQWSRTRKQYERQGILAEPEAIRLAVLAHIRHTRTNYDELLCEQGDRQLARDAVEEQVQEALREWQGGLESV